MIFDESREILLSLERPGRPGEKDAQPARSPGEKHEGPDVGRGPAQCVTDVLRCRYLWTSPSLIADPEGSVLRNVTTSDDRFEGAAPNSNCL